MLVDTNLIHRILLNTLLSGTKRLSDEAGKAVRRFVASQYRDGGFVNKAGDRDLYYSVFGTLLAWTLGMKLDRKAIKGYLSSVDPSSLGDVDAVAYRFLRALLPVLRFPVSVVDAMERLPFVSIIRKRLFLSIPSNHFSDSSTPYQLYLETILAGLQGTRGIITSEIARLLARFKTADGGYSNIASTDRTIATNATSAAYLTALAWGAHDAEAAHSLLKLQHSSGGFVASLVAPVPDILSTATALLVWRCEGIAPDNRAEEFVASHWTEQGGFSATLLDETTDVEYTFYGLLALGAISAEKTYSA